jgi:hypothetical protein
MQNISSFNSPIGQIPSFDNVSSQKTLSSETKTAKPLPPTPTERGIHSSNASVMKKGLDNAPDAKSQAHVADAQASSRSLLSCFAKGASQVVTRAGALALAAPLFLATKAAALLVSGLVGVGVGIAIATVPLLYVMGCKANFAGDLAEMAMKAGAFIAKPGSKATGALLNHAFNRTDQKELMKKIDSGFSIAGGAVGIAGGVVLAALPQLALAIGGGMLRLAGEVLK